MDHRRISELRNLGPACERDLNTLEIFTADDIRKLGVEEAFLRLLKGRLARGTRGNCFNAAYLYALYGALEDCDWREIPEQKKLEFKRLTASLRAKYSLTQANRRKK